jgi:meiotic recombination protein SPO11
LVLLASHKRRDIYYHDPSLFGKQSHVDRYVDDIAYTFQVSRAQLNVTAVAKGLIAGAVSFCRRDGSTFDASADREGVLIPPLADILSVDICNAQWILVVEKEATFRSILACGFWNTIASQGIIVTGKGYPDVATRAMLRYLCTPTPPNGFASPQVYCLVDYDPDGLNIFCVYKHGSMTHAHEADNLCVPSLRWLGLRREHMSLEVHDLHADQGLRSLTMRDRHKAMKMLERCQDAEIRSALQEMLFLNAKAEMQILPSDRMVELLQSGLGNAYCAAV